MQWSFFSKKKKGGLPHDTCHVAISERKIGIVPIFPPMTNVRGIGHKSGTETQN